MPHSEYWPFMASVEVNGEPSLLQKQLGLMEGEVKEIQMELAAIKRDRIDMHVRRQTPYAQEPDDLVKDKCSISDNEVVRRYAAVDPLDAPQIATLREELIRAKNIADEERLQREKYEARLRDLEAKLGGICRVGLVHEKGSLRSTSEEVVALKNQVRNLNDETEELKISAAEKCEQVEEYRAKYMQAQQQAEELRRQVDVLDFDNRQVSDQIQVEIQKMKMQFQAKLQELAPLPEMLQGARAQLHEARQMQSLAEENARSLATEIHHVNEKLVVAVNSFSQEKADRFKLLEENQSLKLTIDEHRTEIDELSRNIDAYKCEALRLEEKLSQQEALYEEKRSECGRLLQELEALRAEGARALSRAKERADGMRRGLRAHVSELERQLVQSRAQCRTCQKERDEMRQRMQTQINNLQESFELTEIRLRSLHGAVASLKSSYTLVLADRAGDLHDHLHEEEEKPRADRHVATH